MRNYLSITKALSDETRLRALLLLCGGELCVCQIIDVLGLAPSTISKHMALLQAAGLVERRKDGRWHFYRLAQRGADPVVRQALRFTLDSLEAGPVASADRKKLGCASKKDMTEICECYRN